MSDSSNPFDVVPYEALGIPYTLPAHLSLCSAWHGGPKTKVETYRAIELGCGIGGNLIPMAYYQRDCSFLGIDYSKRHIECARETVAELGLDNIHFELCDIRDLGDGIGKINQAMGKAASEPFDYVIAHGFFSWIPEDARAAVMTFCRGYLSLNGIAYICYNTMPGWAMRGVVRDALLRSPTVRSATLPNQAIEAKRTASNMLEDLPTREFAFGALLGHELERIKGCDPFYIQHEYLAENNEPFWFADFAALADRYELDYIAEALFCRTEGQIPASVKEALSRRDYAWVDREEATDLLCNRQMRTSILCRRDAQRSELTHRELLNEVSIATRLPAQSEDIKLGEGISELFDGEDDMDISLEFSLSKAAVLILNEFWPLGLTFKELYERSEQMLLECRIPMPSNGREKLEEEIISLFSYGQLHLRLTTPAVPKPHQHYPVAHSLVQFEVRKRNTLSTPYHTMLFNEGDFTELIRMLDGSHSMIDLESKFDKDFVKDMIRTLACWGLLQDHSDSS